MKTLTSAELNTEITLLEDTANEKPIFYWGWYWREVDFDADHVYLAWSPEQPPDWHRHSAEHLLGLGWHGKKTGFCQNNKWGYETFKVEGEQWDELRRLVRLVVEEPTDENSQAVTTYMMEITP